MLVVRPFYTILAVSLLSWAVIGSVRADGRLRGIVISPHVAAADIEDLDRALRPTLLRFNLMADPTFDSPNLERYYNWLNEALDSFDEILPTISARGMKVMLCLYTPPGGFSDRVPPAVHRIFVDTDAQEAFIKVWKKIAERYKSNTTVVMFNLLNEPAQNTKKTVEMNLKDWNQLAQEAALAIRSVDKTHAIVVGPIYGNPIAFARLKPLQAVENVIYSPHFYYTLAFLHQGLYHRKVGVSYPTRSFNKKALRRHMRRAVTFARRNRASMLVSEFTSIRWAPGSSSFLYLRDAINLFESLRWGWIYHAWRESEAFSVELPAGELTSRDTIDDTSRLRLLKILFARSRN